MYFEISSLPYIYTVTIDINALIIEGDILLHHSHYEEAIASYDKVLAIDPNHTRALNNKGLVLYNLGQHEEAITYYDQALAIEPNFADALNNKGQSKQAIDYYDQALTMEPNDTTILNNKGVSLASLGQHEEAIASYDKVLAIDPNHVKALNNKANAITELMYTISTSYYHDGNRLLTQYNFISYQKESANVLSKVGKYTADDAIALFDKALELSPNNNIIICNKANLLTKTGNSDEASVYYQKALDHGHTCPSEQVNIVEPVKVSFPSAK